MNIFKKLIFKYLLIILFAAAFTFRLYGINWDNGYHFHPDERMLIMVADRIKFFSQLNPDFFNYGSLPIYILVGISQIIELATHARVANYDGMLYVGRFLSVINEMIVLILIYKITEFLFEKKYMALLAVFFYTFAFFPIQNAHFFISDTFLNLFTTLLLYVLLLYYKKPGSKKMLAIGIVFAAALTTKITALVFIPIILLVFFLKNKGSFLRKIVSTVQISVLFGIISLFFSFIFMPYAFLKADIFFRDIVLQLQMNSDAYIFPYTLQYVGTFPYWYYIKNIAIYGLGPFIFGFFLLGIYEYFITIDFSKYKKVFKHINAETVFFIFYILYFLTVGRSAVKFMRYMLPLYPFFTIVAGYGAYKLIENLSYRGKQIVIALTVFAVVLWCLAFVNIYAFQNTRIQATQWITQYIRPGSVIAVEHWDDRLPVFDNGRYEFVEMTLYDRPDDEIKWSRLQNNLEQAEYIILASNRLYTPLQRLNDCDKYRYCFPLTDQYYKNLLNGKSEFKKIAEFTSYPNIQIGSLKLEIIDDPADESFTVYDHPKIMIFRKGAKIQ